jgi:hypothetical protein
MRDTLKSPSDLCSYNKCFTVCPMSYAVVRHMHRYYTLQRAYVMWSRNVRQTTAVQVGPLQQGTRTLSVCPFPKFSFMLLDGQFTAARAEKGGQQQGALISCTENLHLWHPLLAKEWHTSDTFKIWLWWLFRIIRTTADYFLLAYRWPCEQIHMIITCCLFAICLCRGDKETCLARTTPTFDHKPSINKNDGYFAEIALKNQFTLYLNTEMTYAAR